MLKLVPVTYIVASFMSKNINLILMPLCAYVYMCISILNWHTEIAKYKAFKNGKYYTILEFLQMMAGKPFLCFQGVVSWWNGIHFNYCSSWVNCHCFHLGFSPDLYIFFPALISRSGDYNVILDQRKVTSLHLMQYYCSTSSNLEFIMLVFILTFYPKGFCSKLNF